MNKQAQMLAGELTGNQLDETEEGVWVFAQINVPEGEGLEDYFYAGRIQKSLYEEMLRGKRDKGFILFRDVRYWSDQNQFEAYEDKIYKGDLTFRIEHIVKMDLQKGDPLVLSKDASSIEESKSLEESLEQTNNKESEKTQK